MTRTYDDRRHWHGRMITALAVAAPAFALSWQLSWHQPAEQRGAAMLAARPAQAATATAAVPPTAGPAHLLSRFTGPGRHHGHASHSPVAPTPHSSPAAPALSISVSDGRHFVQAGDLVTYTIKIRNIGVANAPGLKVVQTLPPDMRLISASAHARSHSGQLTWRVNLPARGTDTFRVVGRVGRTPKELLRLATVACASSRHSPAPIVCATRSDELPAGAVTAANASHPAPAAPAGQGSGFLPVAIALALMTAGACTWLWIRRRPRRVTGHRSN